MAVVIVGAVIVLVTTNATGTPAASQPAPASPFEMHFSVGDGTYSAPLRPGEVTSASAIGPDGELLGVMRSEYLSTLSEPADQEAAGGSGPPFTSAWRHTTEGMEATGAMNGIQKRLSHPTNAVHGPDMPPAVVTVALIVGSDPLGTEPSTPALRTAFLRFLGRSPVLSLVDEVAAIPVGASWSSYGGNGRLMLGAILGDTEDEQMAPRASALFNLPSNQQVAFQSSRSSELILRIECRDADGAPASPASLSEWHTRLVTVLGIPAAFAEFLADEVRVATRGEPPVQLGIRLEARPNLTALVDIGASRRLAGTTVTTEFPSYLIGSRSGTPPARAALDILRTWCDHALHLDDYEAQLAELSC
jgi:hypothetical protein